MARRFAPFGWLFMAVLCGTVLLICFGVGFFVMIPDAKNLDTCLKTEMFEIDLCRTSKNYVPLKQISPNIRNAVIVSEDAAFWDHQGIDWVELRKSFETNLEKGRFARGGSTITQQLAKNVYLTADKTLLRKIREAVIAIRIERQYTKELILEKYLNVVEFDKGIYGVKLAARHYFQVTPANLSIAQSAWLAFLLPNPEKYSVSFHKSKLTPFAFKQMREIINRLARFKRISDDERKQAIREAKSFFGGLSGDSKELEVELDQYEDDIDSAPLEETETFLEETMTSPSNSLEPIRTSPIAPEDSGNLEIPAEPVEPTEPETPTSDDP